jgi:cell division protein FtsZ
MQARMPRVEDFPAVAQRQIRASQAPSQGGDEERRPRGLLARLASGLSRREDEYAESPRSGQQSRAEMAIEPRVVASAPASQAPSNSAADFAKQAQPRRIGEASGAAGNLDPRGRPAPIDPRHDDQLEIPAFLRRQTS